MIVMFFLDLDDGYKDVNLKIILQTVQGSIYNGASVFEHLH